MKCPHEMVQFCPLYVESHNGRMMGCVDDLEKPCMVADGRLVYAEAVGKLMAVDAQLVARCRFAEEEAQATAQRNRNMRAAGIH